MRIRLVRSGDHTEGLFFHHMLFTYTKHGSLSVFCGWDGRAPGTLLLMILEKRR